MPTIRCKIVAIAVLSSLCMVGYTLTAYGGMDPDLVVDNTRCDFSDGKSLYIDTQTTSRSFVLSNTFLQIRSHYLSFYDLNISDGHADTNVVSGDYCYATIPSINATLIDVREVDNLGFSTDSGSATVALLKNTRTTIKILVNSSNDASLNIFVYDLIPFDKYKFSVDGHRVEITKASESGSLIFAYDGDWSSHVLTISYEGFIYWGDFAVTMMWVGGGFGAILLFYVMVSSRRGRGGRG